MPPAEDSLYSRLGGYDAIAAVVDDLLVRLHEDPRLRRFWTSPRTDSSNRERQLAVDFIAAAAGGPNFYL
jgi:hemoglobin